MNTKTLATLLVAASTIGTERSRAPQGPSTTWTATLRSSQSTRMLRFIVAPATSNDAFRIAADGQAPESAAAATDVEIAGVTVRFRTSLAGGLDCAVDAVPRRGYDGYCVATAGDTLALTLIPPLPGMLLPDHEVLLARDAGPPHIAREATVLVLGASGYTEAARGTNGFTCFIERPRPDDSWPICHNREAMEALLPVEQQRAAWRTAGVSERAIADSVRRGHADGRFRSPASGAMGYMLSRFAWTATSDSAGRSFLGPHLHFYAARTTNAAIGVTPGTRPVVPMRVEREGQPDASVIVGVRVIEPPTGRSP